jgi:Fe2+ or Zn2+ uptake regulation protein
MLRETGLVQQYYISPDHSESRFRLIEPPVPTQPLGAYSIAESLHFHCLHCGQVTVLDSSELVDLVQKILEAQTNGFRLKQICMCAEGYCPKCAKAAR